MSSPTKDRKNYRAGLTATRVEWMLDLIRPGEFAKDDHNRFLRCIHFVSNGSDAVLETLIGIYRREGDLIEDSEMKIRDTWSSLANPSGEDFVKAELRAVCERQLSLDLLRALFDDIKPGNAEVLRECIYQATMRRYEKMPYGGRSERIQNMKYVFVQTCEGFWPYELEPDELAALEDKLMFMALI